MIYPHAYRRDKGIILVFLMCLGFALASCAPLRQSAYPAEAAHERCLPGFPDQDGWYGADGAYSIPLDEERTLWLFGDSFVSEEAGRKDRVGMEVLLGTTLAISACPKNADFQIHYYLKKKDGKFVSAFNGREILWPQDPFITEGALYIPLLIIRNVSGAPPPFNFKIAGHRIARIRDFTGDDPRLWPVDYLEWTSALPAGLEALATTSVVVQGHVYFFPLYRFTRDGLRVSGNILARISVNHLEDPAGHFEYFSSAGTWLAELKPEEVKIVFPAGVSEMSVRYHRQDGQWVAVYQSPESKGSRLLYQTAANLEGPWSLPKTLIESVPELTYQSPLYDKNTFCYAGKEHPRFAQNGNIVVTYVCNSAADPNDPKSFLRKNLFLYRPVVRTVSR